MKRKPLPLAIAAGVGSFITYIGDASAQTSLTLYSIVHERGGVTGNVTKLTSGVQSGSRLGFKGSEDLGGDLSAKFQLESGFNTNTGTMGQAVCCSAAKPSSVSAAAETI